MADNPENNISEPDYENISSTAEDLEDTFDDKDQGYEFSPSYALLCPGMFVSLMSRVEFGIATNLGIVLLFLSSSLLAERFGMFPIYTTGSVIFLLLAVWILGFIKIIHTSREVSEYHFLAFSKIQWVSFAVLSFWFPMLLSCYISINVIWQRVYVEDDTMRPSIEAYDNVLVDRLAYLFTPPEYGDLVMIEEEPRTENAIVHKYLGRVIAKGKDEIQLKGVQPRINKKPLDQYYHQMEGFDRTVGIAYELPFGTPPPQDDLNEPDRWYPILTPRQMLLSQTNTVRLEPDLYFILEDNRANNPDRSSYGSIVRRSEIKGKVTYVMGNKLQKSRWGLALR